MCFNSGGGSSSPSIDDIIDNFPDDISKQIKKRVREIRESQKASGPPLQQSVASFGIFAPQASILETYRHDQETTRLPGGAVPAYQSRGAYPQAVVNPYLPRVG